MTQAEIAGLNLPKDNREELSAVLRRCLGKLDLVGAGLLLGLYALLVLSCMALMAFLFPLWRVSQWLGSCFGFRFGSFTK